MKRKRSNEILKKSKTEEIKTLANKIVLSKKNCNSLVEILQVVEEDNSAEVCSACIRALHKVFSHYLDSNELQHTQKQLEASELKLKEWLRERYEQTIDCLIDYMTHETSAVQELALCTLMKFVECEGKKPLEISNKTQFPLKLFEKVVSSLLTCAEDQTDLIGRFQEYLEYDDVRYNYMKCLQQLVCSSEASSEPIERETVYENILSALLVVTLPPTDEKLANFLVPSTNVSSVVSSVKVQRELFSKVWLAFVKVKLTSKMYKKILVSLPDKVIPYLHDPLVVSDWLISCYDRGGALSLMSLNGLFVLMTKYNLEYPDFYNKLYNIMDTEVFSAKYKARFFHLLDLFLRSLLLPTSTTAAFIKKLSRMALTAPPHGVMLIIELVINLLVRHDTCRMLIHRESTCSLQADPYLAQETDISKCRAMESSLWEIKTLQSHWHHHIATQALRIEKPLPQTESVLDDLLEMDYEQMMLKEVKKSKKVKAKEASGQTEVPISHIAPGSLLSWDDSLQDLWVLTEG